MYFANFPKIYYQFQYASGPSLQIVSDITANIRPIREILENTSYYNDYDIHDGDTPEVIAERIYGDPFLHWVILLVNEKYHWQRDFPIPDEFFEEYLIQQYGDAVDGIHSLYGRAHHVLTDGTIVDAGTLGSRAITNREYEIQLNEKKRRIRIVSPTLIGTFIQDLQRAFPSE